MNNKETCETEIKKGGKRDVASTGTGGTVENKHELRMCGVLCDAMRMRCGMRARANINVLSSSLSSVRRGT